MLPQECHDKFLVAVDIPKHLKHPVLRSVIGKLHRPIAERVQPKPAARFDDGLSAFLVGNQNVGRLKSRQIERLARRCADRAVRPVLPSRFIIEK